MTATHDEPVVHEPQITAVTPLRIALVADDEVTTRGVASMLHERRNDFRLVTMASRETAPIDIALYDPALGGPSRLDRLAELLSDTRVRKVAIFTSRFDPSRALAFTEQGACAYLLKSMTSTELVDILNLIHAGQVVVSAGAVSASASPSYAASYGEVLAPREAEVLSLIAGGMSNTEIAQALNLSVNSVKSYIRTCYRKIEVDSRSKAVLWALNTGLIDVQRLAQATSPLRLVID